MYIGVSPRDEIAFAPYEKDRTSSGWRNCAEVAAIVARRRSVVPVASPLSGSRRSVGLGLAAASADHRDDLLQVRRRRSRSPRSLVRAVAGDRCVVELAAHARALAPARGGRRKSLRYVLSTAAGLTEPEAGKRVVC